MMINTICGNYLVEIDNYTYMQTLFVFKFKCIIRCKINRVIRLTAVNDFLHGGIIPLVNIQCTETFYF